MAAPKKYSDELRERATRMALDAIEAEGQRMAAIRDVEIAVAEYVDWYHHRRLHGELGQRTPAEVESGPREASYDQTAEPTRAG